MKYEYCSLFQDIIPLYGDGVLSDDTISIMEKHLKECSKCKECFLMYNADCANKAYDISSIRDIRDTNSIINRDDIGNEGIFNEADRAEPEFPKEKRFVRRVRRTLLGVAASVLVILLSTNILAFAVGQTAGRYGQRFKLAEEKGLFIETGLHKVFNGEDIVLEKALMDGTVTSLIFKTDVDLNAIDSITLKDDKGNYYRKTHTLFNAVPAAYKKVNGYTVLDFEPVQKETKELVLELIEWKKDSLKNGIDEIAEFNVQVQPDFVQQNISEAYDIMEKDISDITFSINKLIRSVSQTEVCYTFDCEKSRYDGVTIGWYHDEYMDNKDKISVTDPETGVVIPVLSTEDITHELLIRSPGSEKSSMHRMLLAPLHEGSGAIRIVFSDVFGYLNLGNEEITVEKKDGIAAGGTRSIKAGDLTLKIISVQWLDNSIVLEYSAEDSSGSIVRDVMLDARIRSADDIYAVPHEGEHQKGDGVNTVIFKNAPDESCVISLARLGERIEMGNIDADIY